MTIPPIVRRVRSLASPTRPRAPGVVRSSGRPGGDRAVVVVAPLRPRARVERGVEPGDRERGDLVGGGDAGAAVGGDVDAVAYAERLEPRGAARLPGRKRPSRVEVVGRRRADGARDVAGLRVDRLGLARGSARRRARRAARRRRTPRRRCRSSARVRASSVDVARLRHDVIGRPARRPAATHAARPPSSRRTSASPAQRSSHQARAAARLPLSSYATTVSPVADAPPAGRSLQRLDRGQRVPAVLSARRAPASSVSRSTKTAPGRWPGEVARRAREGRRASSGRRAGRCARSRTSAPAPGSGCSRSQTIDRSSPLGRDRRRTAPSRVRDLG